MNEHRERDAEIVGLLKQGAPKRALAQFFNLSLSRINSIEEEAVDRSAAQGRAEAVAARMREVNDLDHPWPIEDLMDGLNLSPRTRKCLERYMWADMKGAASLRGLLDSLMADVDAGSDMNVLFPCFAAKDFGQHTFRYVVAALCRVDFGEAFRQEWTRRRLRAAEAYLNPDITTSIPYMLITGKAPDHFD